MRILPPRDPELVPWRWVRAPSACDARSYLLVAAPGRRWFPDGFWGIRGNFLFLNDSTGLPAAGLGVGVGFGLGLVGMFGGGLEGRAVVEMRCGGFGSPRFCEG